MSNVMEATNRRKLAVGGCALLLLVSGCSDGSLERTASGGTPRRVEPDIAPTAEPTLRVAPSTTLDGTDSDPVASTSTVPEPAPARSRFPSTTTTSTTTTTTAPPPLDPPTFESLDGINTIPDFTDYVSEGRSRWLRSVPEIEDVDITSTADGADQPALWLAPTGGRDQPLLVILHSWSAPYLQHAGIPYAMWARENGWAVIAPQFRGVNDDADAIGSDLAVQDAVDAIDWAVAQDGVDADRVYAVGYSGGGMMGLLLAGRHPDRVTAVAAWGPPYELEEFYRHSRRTGQHYAGDIRLACGGDPREPGPAREECLRRSPITYLDSARDQQVPIYIAQGIVDQFVSPTEGARAFNQLADPEDRLSDEQVEAFGRGRVPLHPSQAITTETFFGEGDPAPLFARQSGAAWLVFFQSGHDMAYKASLRWFASDPR